MKTCYIVGAGEFGDGLPCPDAEDMVIACDGGFAHCMEKGISMDLVVGDFDSLGYVPEHANLICLQPEKDVTDMGYALEEGWKRGFRRFVLYGGTGGRISHTIANVGLLADLAKRGGEGLMIGKDSWYRVVLDGEICFSEKEIGFLSVFCLGDVAEGVWLEGLKYELHGAVLVKEQPLGVSNEFVGKPCRVAVKNGTLLLIGEKK